MLLLQPSVLILGTLIVGQSGPTSYQVLGGLCSALRSLFSLLPMLYPAIVSGWTASSSGLLYWNGWGIGSLIVISCILVLFSEKKRFIGRLCCHRHALLFDYEAASPYQVFIRLLKSIKF